MIEVRMNSEGYVHVESVRGGVLRRFDGVEMCTVYHLPVLPWNWNSEHLSPSNGMWHPQTFDMQHYKTDVQSEHRQNPIPLPSTRLSLLLYHIAR